MRVEITRRPTADDPYFGGHIYASSGASLEWRALMRREPGGWQSEIEFRTARDVVADSAGARQVVEAIGRAIDEELGTVLDPSRTVVGARPDR